MSFQKYLHTACPNRAVAVKETFFMSYTKIPNILRTKLVKKLFPFKISSFFYIILYFLGKGGNYPAPFMNQSTWHGKNLKLFAPSTSLVSTFFFKTIDEKQAKQ